VNGFANKASINGVFSKNGSGEAQATEKMQPLSKTYVGLGEGKGVKIAVWPNSVTLQRTEKKDGQWQTTEEFHLAYSVLKEMAWRTTHWLQQMDAIRENEKFEKKKVA